MSNEEFELNDMSYENDIVAYRKSFETVNNPTQPGQVVNKRRCLEDFLEESKLLAELKDQDIYSD